MGAVDKTFATLAGRPLINWVLNGLRPQAEPIAISSNAPAHLFESLGVPVLKDPALGKVGEAGEAFRGPLAGILAGLEWAAQTGADKVVTVPVDMPFVPAGLCDALVAATNAKPGSPALAAAHESSGRAVRHFAMGLWPVCAAAAIKAHLQAGQFKVRTAADALGATEVIFNAQEATLMNINTPEDLARAETLVATGQLAG